MIKKIILAAKRLVLKAREWTDGEAEDIHNKQHEAAA
jgi:hypothetical protein